MSRTKPATTSPSVQKGRGSKRRYRRPLDDPLREALAQRVYTLVGCLSVEKPLSLYNARKLVEQYGANLVRYALQRLERGKSIRSAAGFLVTFLRSESKFGAGV
jgi:hypothetical protein